MWGASIGACPLFIQLKHILTMRNFMNSIALPKVGVNAFDLGHDVKQSFNMGELVPVLCQEILPGDRYSISITNMLRFAPLVSPVMHRVRVHTDFFFVPNRILWPEWEDFISGNSTVEPPYFTSGPTATWPNEIVPGMLADYLGYVSPAAGSLRLSALPIAAYAKIYDDYYRDENLQAEFFEPLVPGDQNWVLTPSNTPYLRAWERDYFTAALPFAQKGDAVQIPLTFQQNIPVDFEANGAAGTARAPIGGAIIGLDGPVETQGGAGVLTVSDGVGTSAMAYDPNGTLVVDVQSDATDINTLRQAIALQRFLEIDARGGTRYTETLRAHFNVRSSDARLQRPEFLGRVHQNMVISEVLSTAQTNTTEGDAEIPVGYMAGHGISVGSGNRISFRAEEHGFIIGIISVRPDTAYQQGLHRMFTRETREDYYWPSFAHLGEQEVKLKELWLGDVADPEEYESTFGYMPRYGEYRYTNSRVAGEMKSSLSYWHLGRIFGTDIADKPLLNDSFIKCEPSRRIFAVEDPDFDTIYAHHIFDIKAVRAIPKFGIPSI